MMDRRAQIAGVALFALVFAADCGVDDGARSRLPVQPERADKQCLKPPDMGTSFRFALIGDFGTGGTRAAKVASLVAMQGAKFVVTAGDNGYGSVDYEDVVGEEELYETYLGCQLNGEDVNRFWPSVGNHDVTDVKIDNYEDYFKVGRSYDVVIGNVHLFVVDSMGNLDDQREWLEGALRASTACHRLVVFHHSAYSSARHGSDSRMQWDFASWGATAVLSGHDHVYERIERDGIVYIVNGLGGQDTYKFRSEHVDGSRERYNSQHGAVIVDVDGDEITYRFIDITGETRDRATYRCSGAGGGGDGVFERRIRDGGDDIEEMSSGAIYADSSDLELAYSSDEDTTVVGMRFVDVDVPLGASITRAYVQFTSDEVGTEPADLSIHAWLTPDASPLGVAPHAVSGRPPTLGSVRWSPGAWSVEGAATSNERTPELREVIQELVDQPQWSPGNAIAIIVSGSGTRTAQAYERDPSRAAVLRVEYTEDGDPDGGGGGCHDDAPSGGGEIKILGTEVAYDSNGQGLSVARPSAVEAGDLMVLALHRTDDDLPLQVDGWTRAAECYKRDNGYDCATKEDCESYQDEAKRFCESFGWGGNGHDLAQAIFYRVACAGEPETFEFDLNEDDSGHPGWAILTALRGAATTDPVRSWSHVGCDDHEDSMFPSVDGEQGDLVLLSMSFDDAIAKSKFGAPDGTSTLGYVSQSDEAGFLFGGIVTWDDDRGLKTHGDGGPKCKDALVSLVIKPR